MQHFADFDVNSLQNPVWIYDVLDYQVYWANTAALSLWETDSLEELQQRDFRTGSSEAVQQTLLGYLRDCEAGRSIESWWRISPKGIDKHVFLKYTGIKIKDGRTAMLIEGVRSEVLSHSVGEVSKSSLLGLFNQHDELISFNPPFKDQFGQDVKFFADLFTDTVHLSDLIGSAQCRYSDDHLLVTQQGPRWHHMELNREVNSNRVIVALMDIHERKLSELKHEKAASTDALTGLLNRRGLNEKLSTLSTTPHTLYFIDLDGFKPINDSYGHTVGDTLLQKVARLLKQSIYDDVICARLGGDEFVVVIPKPLSPNQRTAIASDIVQRLSTPMQVDTIHRTLISASVGLAHYPTDVESAERVLLCADAAMYLAKRNGRNRYVNYVPGMEEHLLKRSLIVQHLADAMSQQELTLHYQVIHNQANRSVWGVEALLRWNHPTLGYISPLEIITAAEETGRISALENWVFRRACLDLVALKKVYGNDIKVAINISGAHLTQQNFIHDIASALEESNTHPNDIVIELTESVLVNALENHSFTLQKLRSCGIAFAIDDFGTGYSSLAYLSQIPASLVKIDKAFIDNISTDPHTVRFIRDLCQNLNIHCLAEGVEHADQAIQLDQLNIHFRQGYFYARPLPLYALMAN